MDDPELPRIWIVTDPDHSEGPIPPLERTLRELPPGVVGAQLRARTTPDRQLVLWARALRAVTRAAGCPLAINQRPDVARIVGADAVHLPERGMSVAEARAVWPEVRWVGASRHDRDGLRRAEADGASYAFVSPVFEVPGKGAPLGVDGFRRTIAGVGMPTYALGGIAAGRIGPLIAAGARGVAVRRAVYATSDPATALDAMVRELDNAGGSGE